MPLIHQSFLNETATLVDDSSAKLLQISLFSSKTQNIELKKITQ